MFGHVGFFNSLAEGFKAAASARFQTIERGYQ